MKQEGMVSKYTIAKFKPHHDKANEEELKYELSDYVNWFNNHRIHSSLGYQTPVEYRVNHLKKVV